jgi:hypothetical protein
MRKNSYKGNKTPFEIIKEEENIKYATLSKSILDFPTCILDEKLNPFIKGGYYLALPTRHSLQLFDIKITNLPGRRNCEQNSTLSIAIFK